MRWEDYRGAQNVPDDASYIGPPGAPKFNNFPNAGAMAELQAVAANPANAVRTGTSVNINFRDFVVDPTANSLCDTRTPAGIASQACLYQAQGRVAYALVRAPQAGAYTLQAAHDDNVVLELSSDYANTNYRAANYDIPVGAVGAWTGGEDIYDNFGAFTASNANSCVLLRMWWTNQAGQNFNRLQWARPDGTVEIIPASAFHDPADPGSATGCNGSFEAIPQLGLRKLRPGGNFVVGTNRAYTLIPSNGGEVPTSGTITIVDILPAGLTFVSATGTGWTCSAAGQAVTCTSSAVIPANSVGNTISLTVAVGAAAVPSVVNSARVSGGGDPTCPASGPTRSDCTPSNTTTVIDAPNLEVGKSGPANATVGGAYNYTITVTNTGSVATTADATVTDVVPAGLTINTATSCTIAGQTVTCPIPAGLSNVAPDNTASFTINVTPQASTAGTTVTNTASVSGGGDSQCATLGSCPSPPVDTVIGVSAAYSFCAVPNGTATSNATYSVVNGVQIARYEPGAGADAVVPELATPISGNLNALMIDSVRDRLLFHDASGSQLWAYDADNGGWYVAATGVTGNFPRGGMTAAGVGYLMEGGASPAVRRIDPNGTYGYTVTNLGNVTYDIAPTGSNASGDIAFDANGDAWLLVGRDLYLVDMATLDATRQTRPLIGGVEPTIDFAGIAFADDGSLYLANNAGGGGSAYYRYDFATGALTQSALTAAGASRDLASCAFPAQAEPDLSAVKTLAQVNGAAYTAGTPVAAGDVLTYAITISNAGTAVGTLYPGSVIESVPANTAYVATGNAFSQASGANWTTGTAVNVPAGGNAVLNFVVQVDDPLPAGIASIANNVAFPAGPPGPPGGLIDCAAAANDCAETTPLGPTTRVAKTSNPASGAAVSAGTTIAYALTVTVANVPTTEAITLTDTLGAGLTLSGALPAGCSAAGQVVTCVLAAGAAVGTYAFNYSATVDADAIGLLGNVVVPTTTPGGDPDPTCTAGCATTHSLTPVTAVAKTSNPTSGTTVNPGDTIAYTLTVTVANAPTVEAITLTDTLGAGLTFSGALPAGCSVAGQVVTCVLAAGAAIGAHAFDYSATVDANATGSLGNVVVPTTPPGGDPDPICTAGCATEHIVMAPSITVAKSANPGSGAEIRAGDTITYTLTTTVANSATTEVLTLTDTLGAGLSFGTVTDAGAFACTGSLACTLPAGTLPGTYALSYTATVDANAVGTLRNVVVPSVPSVPPGGPGAPTCTTCTTEHELIASRVVVAKSATPGDGHEVHVGDTIQYTLTVTVENSATRTDVRLTDTPGMGLVLGTLPAGCAVQGTNMVCTLPTGAVPGVYTFTYPATVTAAARDNIENVVIGESGGGEPSPECTVCGTQHRLADEARLRVAKAASVRNVAIGDLVRYTLTIENVGAVNVTSATVVDTPPAGFSYVEGSMTVADRDGAFTLGGKYPLRIGGLDIDAGEHATVVYLLRVGAGVKPGMHRNQAVAVNDAGGPISNVATAQVALDSDPLLDDSLIFGTVFDDRDGDGWQDRADLGGVRVQGGFAPGVYIAGSTTIDRGNGPQPLADASAPLLHGVDIGGISARQSEADPAQAHRVTIRQRVSSVDFTDDFVLTSAQGITVRMDAAGNTMAERSGEAAKGLTAAAPTVERTVSAVDGGYEVAYAISNAGIDERGIPGVRIASVEGLLIETDQYGRYHLADVQGGDWGHGRNFILKVDPATLPPGTVFTTENPRVRRVTPGLPVRFDFGVKLPVQVLEGGERKVELELGEVVFAPGSAEVREAYLPAIQKMAEKVDEYHGGEVVISADGDSEGLAFARAEAVRDALQARVDTAVKAELSVVLRSRVDDPRSLVTGVDAHGALLGTVLFDTDKSAIRPEFEGLLDAVAQRLERLGGGVVALVGHTDVRASHAYNAALGLRRATAVQQALVRRLSPEVRARVRVETGSDPAVPVGTERK